MGMSLSMSDVSRPEPAALVQVRDQMAPGDRPAPGDAPDAPSRLRGPGFAEAAVSLTQVGLVGWAMIEGAASSPAASPARPGAAPGEPRHVERVLAPWGVPMLPSEAALAAREAAEAQREAALNGNGKGSDQPAKEAGAAAVLAGAAREDDPLPGMSAQALRDAGGPSPAESRRARLPEAAGSPGAPESDVAGTVVAGGDGAGTGVSAS